MFKSLKKTEKGFTIIELLIVIAIIIILAALVLNNFQGAQAKARDTQRVTDINNIHSKLEEYYNENNYYPSTFTASTFPGIDGESLKDPKGQTVTINAAVADQTAAQAVANPGTGNNYLYVPYNCTGTGNTECVGYVLKTYIEKPSATTPNPTVKLGLNNI
ncbi:prepilin-type N-terminal cleavage/methylation domain-containing protein [Candidatus Saccharibacteria bacterium]|nr:prepilin-type N-terminal cleavage/methylation domain-containing protein [Candidatus Saccharibacteria bacterium]MBI3338212.1 prepilin-type N-terminal cleavage/methylation domain-containing protein [Candidatus Saccharibacteria bacterium]